MGKVILILGLAVLVLAMIAGWQIASCELANFELQEDLTDLAAQAGVGIGLVPPSSDDDLRSAVIRKAREREVQLGPNQVTVQRTAMAEKSVVHLAVDYQKSVNLLGFSFTFHFTPSSTTKAGA